MITTLHTKTLTAELTYLAMCVSEHTNAEIMVSYLAHVDALHVTVHEHGWKHIDSTPGGRNLHIYFEFESHAEQLELLIDQLLDILATGEVNLNPAVRWW